jgi:hypothetical protein
MREIRIIERQGSSISEDVDASIAHLKQAGISCQPKTLVADEYGFGIIYLHEDSDLELALYLLLKDGFEVVTPRITESPSP